MTRAATGTAAVEAAVRQCLDRQVRPLLRLHGGDCELLGVRDGVVRLRFVMACTACKLRPMTLLAAVRPRLLRVPGVVDVQAAGVGVSGAAVRRVDAALGAWPRPERPGSPAPAERASDEEVIDEPAGRARRPPHR